MGRSGTTKTWPQEKRGRRKLILILNLKPTTGGFFYSIKSRNYEKIFLYSRIGSIPCGMFEG